MSNTQYIGARKPYVLISVEQWEALNKPKESMGQWLGYPQSPYMSWNME